MKKLILVTSPPASGKTYISKKLSEALHHVVYLDKDTLIKLSKQICIKRWITIKTNIIRRSYNMNYNENFTIIYIVFLLVGIPVLLLILIIWGIPGIIRRLTYEVCTYKTIIIDDKVDVIYSQGRYLVNSYMIYLLSFKFEDEEIIEFSLQRKEYKKHHIGDVGKL